VYVWFFLLHTEWGYVMSGKWNNVILNSVSVCISVSFNESNNAVHVQNGQTPLSIAQQLGYISVVEILKNVTTVTVTTPTVDEKYKVVFPEMMQEAPIDSDEEGGESLLS